MKKIVATLLFFIFANSFFAPVFSASNVVKQMSLNITDSSFDNLESAAKFFKKQVDFLCSGKKDKKDADIPDICKNGIPNIPNTQDILNNFSKDKKNDTDFQKKFFEVVVGFYNELNSYKISLNKINSETEIAVKTQQLLVKSTIGKLIKKLNEERKTLDDVNALFDERAKKYDELTDLNWNNVKAVTPDLQKYASDDFKKYRKDNKIEPHIEKTYAGLNDVEGLLKQKDGESLDDWLTRIGELKKSLQDEVKKTDTNIEVLKAIKVEREKENDTKLKSDLGDAWKKFMDALDDEKDAVEIFDDKLVDKNDYSSKKDKDKVSLKTMNYNLKETKTKLVDVELHEVDNKNEISIADKKDISALIEKLNDETKRANNNADILKKAKIANAFKNCQNELEALSSKSLSEYKPPVTAENCSDVLNELKRDIKGKIETIKEKFDALKERIYTISLMEIVIFNQADNLLNQQNEKPEKMHTEAEWNGEYKKLGYGKDPSPNISYLTEIDNKLNYPTLEGKTLSYSDMDNLIKSFDSVAKDDSDIAKNIDSWLGYIEKVIKVADYDIRLVEDYIKSEMEICPDYKYTLVSDIRGLHGNTKDISSGNLETPTGDQSFKYALYEAVNECLNAEVKKCNENSGTQDMIEYYAIVNGKPNYTSVEDVKNKCFETFKNKCSNKDYKWNLTYDTMKSELKKCEDASGKTKCATHKDNALKTIVANIDAGKKDNALKTIVVNIDAGKVGDVPPACYLNADKLICDAYAQYAQKVITKPQFTFKDITVETDMTNISNCKNLVDEQEKKEKAILDALNACPELQGKKATDFKTVKDVNDACEKAKVENAVKMCNEMANDYKSKNETSFISADVKNYSDVNAVEKACFDKVKKLCDDTKYGDKKYVWSNLTFDNMISQLNACLGNIASLKKAEDEAKKLMALKKIQDLSEKVVCQAYKLSRKYGTSTQSGIGMGARYNNSATSRNDKYEYDVYAEKRTSVVNDVRLDDYTQIVYDYCKSSGGIDPIIQNTKNIKECKSLGYLSNYVPKFLYYEVQFKCGKDTSVGNNWGEICRNARAIYEGCN